MASRLLDQSLADVRRERRTSGSSARAAPYERPQRASEETWKHDKFTERRGAPRRGPSSASHAEQIATKVAIDGLHYEVSEQELKDLFSQIGSIVKGPSIKFDASGRSTGSALVWYRSEADAQAAVDEFDGAKAKGETIQVKVLGTTRLNSGPSKKGTAGRAPSLADRLAGHAPDHRVPPPKPKGARRERNARRAPASAADLDAELDAFMNAPAAQSDQGEVAMEE